MKDFMLEMFKFFFPPIMSYFVAVWVCNRSNSIWLTATFSDDLFENNGKQYAKLLLDNSGGKDADVAQVVMAVGESCKELADGVIGLTTIVKAGAGKQVKIPLATIESVISTFNAEAKARNEPALFAKEGLVTLDIRILESSGREFTRCSKIVTLVDGKINWINY